jgi:hypothetical protein
VEAPVIKLTDLGDAVHESRELLELRPLVVGHPDRDIDDDASFDLGRHDLSFTRTMAVTRHNPVGTTDKRSIINPARKGEREMSRSTQ